MAVGDLLLNPANTDLVQYLQLLAAHRLSLVDYFVDGSMARPAVLNPVPSVLTQKVASGGYPLMNYDSLATATWTLRSDVSSSTVVVLTSTTTMAYSGTLTVDFKNWGFDTVETVSVSTVATEGLRIRLCEIHGPVAELSIEVPGLDVLVLEFAPAVM